MSSAILAVGAPSMPRTGVFSKIGSALTQVINDPAGPPTELEGAIFRKYDDAVENKLGSGTVSSDLGMSMPRMAWRIAAFVGGAAALTLLA